MLLCVGCVSKSNRPDVFGRSRFKKNYVRKFFNFYREEFERILTTDHLLQKWTVKDWLYVVFYTTIVCSTFAKKNSFSLVWLRKKREK